MPRTESTTPAVGHINPDWLVGATVNAGSEAAVAEWIATAGNYDSAEIDAEGCVWVRRAGRRYWLSQEQIDVECDKVDAGV